MAALDRVRKTPGPRAREMIETSRRAYIRQRWPSGASASKGDSFEMVDDGLIEHHVTNCGRTIATTRSQRRRLTTAHS